MFNLYTRMLDMTPRWSVAPTLGTQSVASHSYYVALYTMELCSRINLDSDTTRKALYYALVHDMAEARTGDFPGPVKSRVVNSEALDVYENNVLYQMGLGLYETVVSQDVKDLIKTCDMIEECLYMAFQVGMGNRLLMNQLDMSVKRFKEKLALSSLLAPITYSIETDVEEQIHKLVEGDFWLPHSKGDPFNTPDDPDKAPF